MSFSDARFAYGPFAPHYVPRQYIEGYFANHRADRFLVLGTTVEDVTRIAPQNPDGHDRWRLTLRRYDRGRDVDEWWQEEADAVIFANGHYSVPYVSFKPYGNLEDMRADFVARFPMFLVWKLLLRSFPIVSFTPSSTVRQFLTRTRKFSLWETQHRVTI